MKKEFNKIVLFIGFLATIVGLWISIFTGYVFMGLDLAIISVILALAFVNATNNVLKIVGYSLNVVTGAIGLRALCLMPYFDLGTLIMAIGMMIMTFASIVYFFGFLLAYLGFVKASETESGGEDSHLFNELVRYKEMQDEGILSADEFADLKQNVMGAIDDVKLTMDDLKKWKNLLDQNVITEAEFTYIKKNIFAK